MRLKGRGSIRKRKSGRYNPRVMGFSLGMFDTTEKAEQAIIDFLGSNRCPICKQLIPEGG